MLAGLTKGPTYYSPDRHPDRAQERLAYVLTRMQEDGDAGARFRAKSGLPQMVAYDHVVQRDSGYYFLDHVSREARTLAGIPNLTTASTTVRTTIRPDLQHAAEAALQEGLAQYEMRNGRVEWHGPETNLARSGAPHRGGRRRRQGQARLAAGAGRAPIAALRRALDDRGRARNRHDRNDRGGLRVGLPDGRVVPLSSGVRRGINLYDVVFVKLTEARGARTAAPGSSCGCARWCRAPRSSSTTRPAASSPWSAGSPIR